MPKIRSKYRRPLMPNLLSGGELHLSGRGATAEISDADLQSPEIQRLLSPLVGYVELVPVEEGEPPAPRRPTKNRAKVTDDVTAKKGK